jgi:hypothetical protein
MTPSSASVAPPRGSLLSSLASGHFNPSIVKIRKVSKFFEKFVNDVRSFTRPKPLPSSVKRVVEKSYNKASAKLEEADKESLISLDELEMLPEQNYQPIIRF